LTFADLVDQGLVHGLVSHLADVVNANVELVTLKKLFYFAGSSIMGK
jgi:hypothetical protein